MVAVARRLLLAKRVARTELELAFEESLAEEQAVHVGGDQFFPLILGDIESAQSSVHIVQFGFRPGKVGDRFRDVLLDKARAGVSVRVIVDRNGTDPDRGSRELFESLIAGGAQVCTSSGSQLRAPIGALGREPRGKIWNLRGLGQIDHRKLFVVDGRTGWVGGAGIEDHFEDGRFHDLFVRFRGPVVAQLQLVFLASLRRLGGTAPVQTLDDLFPTHALSGEMVPAVVLHNAGRHRPISDAIAEILEAASSSLDVINPYVSDRAVIRRMIAAAKRGVRVRLFVPATPNNWACGAAERFHHGRLLDAGIEIFEHPRMLHAKAIVCDGKDVLAGTCNLEAWSLRRFFEVNVRIRSRALAQQVEDRFCSPAIATSRAGTRQRGFAERAKSAAFAALSPLL